MCKARSVADSRINLYHNLSTMLAAGVPINRALAMAHKRGRVGRLFGAIARDVAAATSLADAVEARARDFDPLDVALIRVGENTGQLAEVFGMLADWYDFRQRVNRVIRTGLVLPIILIHLLAIFAPIPSFALGGWDTAAYLNDIFTILTMFYFPAAVIVGVFVLAPRRGPIRAVLDGLALKVPLVASGIHDLSLSRYCTVFAIALKAGVPILNAAELAVEAVANVAIRRLLGGGTDAVRQGREMSEGFVQHRLPAEFVAIWQVGEETGDLDTSAARLGNNYGEQAERRFAALAVWIPRLVYAIVAVVMIYYIFKGYSQIYGNLGVNVGY